MVELVAGLRIRSTKRQKAGLPLSPSSRRCVQSVECRLWLLLGETFGRSPGIRRQARPWLVLRCVTLRRLGLRRIPARQRSGSDLS
jgi:hypothetical protein